MYDVTSFNSVLLQTPFCQINNTDDINYATELFNYHFINATNLVAPLVTKTYKHERSLKLSDEIIRERKNRDILCKKAHESNSSAQVWNLYRSKKKEVDKLILQNRKKINHNLLNEQKNDSKLKTVANS